MPDILIRRIGRTLVPANAEAEEAMRKVPERRALKAKVHVPRLPQTHNLLFAVIADVVEHWPHGAEPNPDGDAEHLRGWLLCKVGWCHKLDFPMLSDPKAQQKLLTSIDDLTRRLRARGEHPFWREGVVDGEPAIRVFLPRSINQADVDETQFREIEHAVFDEIEACTGLKVDDLIAEYKARKAREAQEKAA